MQVSVESTGSLERRMTVEIPEERIAGEMNTRLQKLAKSVKIQGFRPGKVPLNIVKRTYGSQVRDEIIGELIQSSYFEALSSEKLSPAGYPEIETADTDNQGLTYTATFEVMPEVTLASFDGVSIESISADVNEEDVDKMLETIQEQRATFAVVERAAQEGDRVNINFEGTIDGESFQGNSGSNVPVVLGSGRMIDGFESGVIGAKADDELTLDLQFPEDYAHKEVAGKPVQFSVKVNSVEEKTLPEIDEEFVKSLGIEEGTVEALRKEVKTNMEKEVEQRTKASMKENVMEKLVELNQIDIPQALIDNEANALLEQMKQQMHSPQGKGIDLDKSMFEEQAKRRVTLGLVMSEIIKQNDIKADAEKVRAHIDQMANSYEKPQEVIDWYYGDKKRLSEIESVVLEQEVVDWITGQVSVTDTKVSFSEVVGHS